MENEVLRGLVAARMALTTDNAMPNAAEVSTAVDILDELVASLENMGKCTNCQCDELSWALSVVNQSGVMDGLLRVHDVQGVLILGCDSCGETIEVNDDLAGLVIARSS